MNICAKQEIIKLNSIIIVGEKNNTEINLEKEFSRSEGLFGIEYPLIMVKQFPGKHQLMTNNVKTQPLVQNL